MLALIAIVDGEKWFVVNAWCDNLGKIVPAQWPVR